jgi:AcrR family transcriptional regulator
MKATPAQRIRAEAKEATRRALLAAGLTETVERGGAVPSIDAICARAGYSRGAFYVYFANRSDFVDHMLQWVVGDIFETLFRGAGEDEADLQTIVERFTQALAKREWPDVTDIRSAYLSVVAGLRESESVRRRHADLMKAALARLEGAIRDGQQTGRFSDTLDSRMLAKIILLVGVGLIVWDDVGIPIDPQDIGQHFLELISKLS